MRTTLRIVGTFVLALLVGGVVGWQTLGADPGPPALPALVDTSADVEPPEANDPAATGSRSSPARPNAALPQHADGPGTARLGKQAPPPAPRAGDDAASAKRLPKPAPTANAAQPQAAESDKVLVPSATSKLRDADPDLLPRGEDAVVVLDLAAVGLTSLPIRRGSMERDGAGRWSKRAPKVGTLQGPTARVLLLHMGYDREGQPVVAHIRTQSAPPVEGMIQVRHGERAVPMRAANRARDSAPDALQAPRPEL